MICRSACTAEYFINSSLCNCTTIYVIMYRLACTAGYFFKCTLCDCTAIYIIISRLACTAGYFFKCPLCNCKDGFEEEMKKFGVFVPEQDASWETEPSAYSGLLER